MPELLASMALMIVVFVAIMGIAHVAQRQNQTAEARVYGLLEQRNGLERMLRELRTATTIQSSSSEVLTYIVPGPPEREVQLDCTQGSGQGGGQGNQYGTKVCQRRSRTKIGTGWGTYSAYQPIVRGVSSDTTNVFCVQQGPSRGRNYIVLRLRVWVKGARSAIPLSGGTALRNNMSEGPPSACHTG